MSFIAPGERAHVVVTRDSEGYVRIVVSGLPEPDAQRLADEVAQMVVDLGGVSVDELAEELKRRLSGEGLDCVPVKVESDNVDTLVLACRIL